MTVSEAIARADGLRVNLLGEEIKAGWIRIVEHGVADMMGKESQLKGSYSADRDTSLLMPPPYDDVYVKYLIAMIDYYNGETGQYANDMELYNEAMSRAGSWWIRNNRPSPKGNWRVM
jgi:hypothetical protein